MSGRGFSYFAQTPGLSLSLKCMFNGRVRYTIDRGEFSVDDGGYLILNEGQPYTIEIASPTLVETFVLWFPNGWADEVLRSLTAPTDKLLSELEGEKKGAFFFERYTPHDQIVSPKVHALRAAFKAGRRIDEGWLEEKLRQLLAAMLRAPLRRRRRQHGRRSSDSRRRLRVNLAFFLPDF